MNRRENVQKKQQTNNYARHVATKEYVFFDDASAPAFTHPQCWAFHHVPAFADADTFRGQLVGVHPADQFSDTETPASAAS